MARGEEDTVVMKRNGWLALVLAAVCVLAEVAVGQDKVPAAGSPWTGPLGMEFAWVPAGIFKMGSPEGEEGRDTDEVQHEVRIRQGFWMGKYEVTQGEWEAVMGGNPSYFESCGARCPVESVSWDDVQEFIRRLNRWESRGGYRYRLPTEAEWEYAARAGSAGATPEGDLRTYGPGYAGVLDGQAWYRGNCGVTYAGGESVREMDRGYEGQSMCGTHPVGLKRANGWELHDMLGNVLEWTGDWYGDYPSGLVTDPRGPSTGSSRVYRGGSWDSYARNVRSSDRNGFSRPAIDDRGGNSAKVRYKRIIGFRLVRTKLIEEVAAVQDDGSLPSVAGSLWKSPIGMEFAWVPAGRFVMGSLEGEEGRNDDELQHEVRISEGFWMGVYEVTQEEWEAVMGANPSAFKACGPRCSVEQVSWFEAEEFIRRLNRWEWGSGYEYRLPTEAEWEYAARAGSTGATPEGDLRILGKHNAPVLDGQAWYGGNAEVTYESGLDCSRFKETQNEAGLCGTHPVGMKQGNAWGLYDMLGNVWEWTGAWYGEYPSGAVTDPRGPSTGSHRVIRGGGWSSGARHVRSASRIIGSPGDRYIILGFRLVRTK